MFTYSLEHKEYLYRIRREKIIVTIFRIFIILLFLILWQLAADFGFINTFLFSSPKNVFNTCIKLFNDGSLFTHTWITLYEVLISFFISMILGLIVSIILWYSRLFSKVIDPYLTVLNSLPKVALGPLIIIWVGASINSIIFMALLISTFVTIINIYNGFIETNKSYITLLKSFGANKWKTFAKAVLPSNYGIIINTLKVNISMCLIGVIMGELLVSKKGLGYLIMYGSQVFNINLVITSVVILGLISYFMYWVISRIEVFITNKIS